MKKKVHVLIVDDHPLIIEAYKSALSVVASKLKNYSFFINTAFDCETAFEKITNAVNSETLDLIFLDISLPPSKKLNILSGEDLGIKINELLPNSKIIISTTYNDNYRLYGIFKNVNPDGFLIKSDITSNRLVKAIEKVIKRPPYYSESVLQLIRQQASVGYVLDSVDRQMLYELSIGTKMKDLPMIIPLSIGALEKRKRKIKEVFEITGKEDRDLMIIAKEKGFI